MYDHPVQPTLRRATDVAYAASLDSCPARGHRCWYDRDLTPYPAPDGFELPPGEYECYQCWMRFIMAGD